MTRSVDDLAADVRYGLFNNVRVTELARAHAALSELVALAGTLTQENASLVMACNVAVEQSERDALALADMRRALEELRVYLGYSTDGEDGLLVGARILARRALAAAGPAPERPARFPRVVNPDAQTGSYAERRAAEIAAGPAPEEGA